MLEDQPFDVWSQVRLLLAKKLASSKRHLQCHEMGMNTTPAGAGLFLVLILVTLKDLGATAAGRADRQTDTSTIAGSGFTHTR
jgi:hypothetical protein